MPRRVCEPGRAFSVWLGEHGDGPTSNCRLAHPWRVIDVVIRDDIGAIINAADTPEQREWDTIIRRDGRKAALAWRDRRYDERLAESGKT